LSHRDAGDPDRDLHGRGGRRLGSVLLSAKVNPADLNADRSDPVTVLLATALAAGVTPAELETGVRGGFWRPGPHPRSVLRTALGSGARGESAPRIWANDDGMTTDRIAAYLNPRQSA
jgi:hypothetical protein